MTYSIFNNLGEIEGVYSGVSPHLQGFGYVTGEFDGTSHYIPDVLLPVVSPKLVNTITEDKSTITSNGIDSVIISNIPVGSELTTTSPDNIENIDLVIVNDGVVNIVANDTGTIEVELLKFPYTLYTLTIVIS